MTFLKCLTSGLGNCYISVYFLFIFITVYTDAQNPELVIWPPQPTQTKFVGHSLVLTCKINAADQNLISNIEWRDYNNRTVQPRRSGGAPQPMHTEENMATNALSLFIPSITENMAGNYTCYATYANERLSKSMRLEVFVAITWKNAPLEQYPIVGKDFKISCEVESSPSPTVDWLYNNQPIVSSQRYAIESKGLLLRNVQETDDGVYTCRAFVPFTGEMKERPIKVEVHIPPQIVEPEQNTFEFVEGEPAQIICNATGKPNPVYTWVKQSTQENVAKSDRFFVNEHTGILRINRVEQQDDSDYKCFAANPAGTVEQTFKVHVLVKPKIYEFLNVSAQDTKPTKIICKATGRPAPHVTFRKFSNKEAYISGVQSDDRIILEINKNEQKGETSATLFINPLSRSDDGLYECIASNTGATAYKNGHLTVEFIPTFPYNLTQPPVWTWDNRPGNLSCFAQAIPNATIEWFLNERPVLNGPNLKIIGGGPQSNLIVTPVTNQYYTKFKCVARNIHGSAYHYVELKQAFPPNVITQAVVEVITATTIRFAIIPPPTYGGLPITAFTVQYKPETELSWQNGRNRTWSMDSPYIVENLSPQKTYNFRFAAHNQVGMGPWSGDQTQTMPSRSSPEEPKILSNAVPNTPVPSPYADHYELRWRIPADNGERIDHYEIKYCPVHKVNDQWAEKDKELCQLQQFPSIETTAYELNQLQSDTHYKIELRAHNAIGYSIPAQIIIKTARGMDTAIIYEHEDSSFSDVLLIGFIIIVIFIVLIVVDVTCYYANQAGIIMCICELIRGKPVEDDDEARLGREEKEPLRTDEHHGIIDNSMKRNTSIEFDGRRVYSKTGECIGKNSAV
ncbi:fasciclin-2 isoform X2 [Chrysoperla carnea]|uniref:fasciclin-2 isoform X2 n=1 Tax=Chrysoperla carnea TaxID=189513 RepID=UPI001D0651E9|nr:fasciclin-2 isoform X2 [Chrysoperla carnea]